MKKWWQKNWNWKTATNERETKPRTFSIHRKRCTYYILSANKGKRNWNRRKEIENKNKKEEELEKEKKREKKHKQCLRCSRLHSSNLKKFLSAFCYSDCHCHCIWLSESHNILLIRATEKKPNNHLKTESTKQKQNQKKERKNTRDYKPNIKLKVDTQLQHDCYSAIDLPLDDLTSWSCKLIRNFCMKNLLCWVLTFVWFYRHVVIGTTPRINRVALWERNTAAKKSSENNKQDIRTAITHHIASHRITNNNSGRRVQVSDQLCVTVTRITQNNSNKS